jgi:hypothetical protein
VSFDSELIGDFVDTTRLVDNGSQQTRWSTETQ